MVFGRMDGTLTQSTPPSHMYGQWKAFILLVSFCPIPSRALNFSQCLVNMISCAQANDQNSSCPYGISNTTALSFLFTNNGPIANIQSTSPNDTIYMSIQVRNCTNYCGEGDESFSWSIFSQEFAAWLLPYLALVSQLPFGSQRRVDNLMSAILTVGSPTLAGYSLYMTLLNARWLNDQLFSRIDYPSAEIRQTVVQVLNRLQHVPLRVHPRRDGRFESLVVHPDNDQWWLKLSEYLDYSHTWSIASATSIAWVVIAYLLTVADSLSSVANNINSNGQGTGYVWLWLLPIVIGWLVLSPKCDYYRVQDAYNRANQQVFEPNSHGPGCTPVTSNFGLTISPNPDWNLRHREFAFSDESSTPPVFNYARILPWSRTVYVTALFYRAAWQKWNGQIGVDGQPITGDVRSGAPPECRMGNRDQIIHYCRPNDREYSSARVFWPPGVLFNMVVASLMSLQLQWATTGAAFLVFWFTPTAGLGCRSLAFLTYGSVSTIIWALLVLSSVLENYAYHLRTSDLPSRDPDIEIRTQSAPAVPTDLQPGDSGVAMPLLELAKDPDPSTERIVLHKTDSDSDGHVQHARRRYIRILSGTADLLRWTGKSLAVINAIGVIAISVFQYANVFDSCYCNSSTISLGARADIVFQPIESEIDQVRRAWLGGAALALASCAFFVGSIYLIRDSLPS